MVPAWGSKQNPDIRVAGRTPDHSRWEKAALLMTALFSFLFVSNANAAQVHLRDGSVVVGELLRLVDGSDLVIDTAHMDEVTVEWDFVDRLVDTRVVEVELYDGRRIRGSLALENGLLRIDGRSTVSVQATSVYSISELKVNWFEAVDAYTTFGLNLVRGNNRVTQANLGAGFDYDDAEYEISGSAATFLNEQTDTGDTRRSSLSTTYRHNYSLGWGATGFYQYERDEQQDLDRRALLAAAVGKRIVNNRSRRLELLGGVAVNDEKFNGLSSNTSNEALLGTRFRLRSTADADAVLIVFQNLEQSDRYRVQFDASLNFDLVADLELDLSIYDRYDSEPPLATDKHDYGMAVGLRWEY